MCWSGNNASVSKHDPVHGVNGNSGGLGFIQVKCKDVAESLQWYSRLLSRGSYLQNLVDLSQLAHGSRSLKVFLQKVSESDCQQEIF